MILFFYVVREIIFPFVMTTGILSAIMLMDQAYQFIPFMEAAGLDAKLLILVLLYTFPAILTASIPVGLMIGTYMGINRVSADYEAISIQAGGISLSFIFIPVFFVSVISALLVLILAFFWGPYGKVETDKLKFNALKTQVKIQLVEKRINNLFNQNLIYIFEKDKNNTLKGVIISDWNEPDKKMTIESETGEIELDERNRTMSFNLKNGKIHRLVNNGQYQISEFKTLNYHIKLPTMDREKLPAKYRDGRKLAAKPLMWMTVPEMYDAMQTMKLDKSTYFKFLNEYHSRIVTVLSGICFAIFAVPLGIFDPRNPKTGKFIYMIVMMVVFYSVSIQARALLLSGKVHPITLYLPLFLSLMVATISYLRINYDLNSVIEWLQNRSVFQNIKRGKG